MHRSWRPSSLRTKPDARAISSLLDIRPEPRSGRAGSEEVSSKDILLVPLILPVSRTRHVATEATTPTALDGPRQPQGNTVSKNEGWPTQSRRAHAGARTNAFQAVYLVITPLLTTFEDHKVTI